jgi:hypothetical protein
MPDKIKPVALTGAAASGGSFELDFNVDLLKIYYDKAFPYDLMFKWLSYFKLKSQN